MQEYISRNIDKELIAWKDDSMRKPLLLRGARQVGKSSAVRHFGREFKYFAEVNFERHKAIKTFFQGDIDVHMIAQKSATISRFLWLQVKPCSSSTRYKSAQKPSWLYDFQGRLSRTSCNSRRFITRIYPRRTPNIRSRENSFLIHVSDDF